MNKNAEFNKRKNKFKNEFMMCDTCSYVIEKPFTGENRTTEQQKQHKKE